MAGQPAELITGRALAQQPGQLGDGRFLDPARPVPTAGVLAGTIGAALADLAAVIERDPPRALGDQCSAAGHASQHLVRDPHPRQLPVPSPPAPKRTGAPRSLRQSVPAPSAPRAALRDLPQRPVFGRHRRDLPERLLLISQHPAITDRPGTISDHAGDVSQYPAPVMPQTRPDHSAPGQACLIRQPAHQAEPRMRHDPGSAARDFQGLCQFYFEEHSGSERYRVVERPVNTPTAPAQEHFSASGAPHPPYPCELTGLIENCG